MLVAEIIIVALHAVNPAHHGPAGGATNLEHYVFLRVGLGNVAAILIGATAGTQDVANGVFRDLVVTGRPRSTLFMRARARALCSSSCRCSRSRFGLAIAVSYVFAGDLPNPSAPRPSWHFDRRTRSRSRSIDVIIAVGLAAFASSRIVVGVLIAWNAIVAHLLLAIDGARQRAQADRRRRGRALPAAESSTTSKIAMSTATALLVLIVWAAVFASVGRWWTTGATRKGV